MIQVIQFTDRQVVHGRKGDILPVSIAGSATATTQSGIATIVSAAGALTKFLQGQGALAQVGLVFNDIGNYGAVAQDNSATRGPVFLPASFPETTQVPPQNLPVGAYIWDVQKNGIFEISKIVANDRTQVYDPDGYAATKPSGWTDPTVLSRTACPMKKVEIRNTNTYRLYMMGKNYQLVPGGANIVMEADPSGEIKPFIVDALGTSVTIIITY
jgi:hypothetical protein